MGGSNPLNSPSAYANATEQIAPKIYQGQPQTMYSECSRFYPNRFTVGGVVAERVNTAKLRPKIIPIFVSKYSFEANNKQAKYLSLTLFRSNVIVGRHWHTHRDNRLLYTATKVHGR